MGAIERQVAQVNLKNSTNCSPPAARLTVVGSVASRFGPRDVATGKGEATADSVEAAITGVEVPRLAGKVGLATADWLGATGEAAGAQAARNKATKIRPGKRRILVIWLLIYLIY
jgi:hypothetical protein